MTGWLPRREQDLADLIHIWVETLGSTVKQQQFGWEAARCNTIVSKLEDFIIKRTSYHDNKTEVNRLIKDTAKKEAETVMRTFANECIRYNPKMTEAHRLPLGIKPRDNVRTDHIEVTEVVEFEIKLRNIRELLIKFWVKNAANKAKPDGYDGAVIVWVIADSPPARPEDFPHHGMASRSPHSLHFDETERGKTVYISAAWQNERGIRGAYSEIQSAVIP